MITWNRTLLCLHRPYVIVPNFTMESGELRFSISMFFDASSLIPTGLPPIL